MSERLADAVIAIDDGVAINVRAQPGAKRSEIVGLHGDALKVRLAAPPVDGKANAELRRHLAKRLRARPSTVTIVKGTTSRDKVIHVAGVVRSDVVRRLGPGP